MNIYVLLSRWSKIFISICGWVCESETHQRIIPVWYWDIVNERHESCPFLPSLLFCYIMISVQVGHARLLLFRSCVFCLFLIYTETLELITGSISCYCWRYTSTTFECECWFTPAKDGGLQICSWNGEAKPLWKIGTLSPSTYLSPVLNFCIILLGLCKRFIRVDKHDWASSVERTLRWRRVQKEEITQLLYVKRFNRFAPSPSLFDSTVELQSCTMKL